MATDKSDTRVDFRPHSEGQDRDRLTLLIPVTGKPVEDDKRLEAALAITELANASPQARPGSALLGGTRTTALGLVKGLIPVHHPLLLQSLAKQVPPRGPTRILYGGGGISDAHMPRLKRKKRKQADGDAESRPAPKQARSRRKPTLKELIEQKKQSEGVHPVTSPHEDSDEDQPSGPLVLKPDALKAFMSWQEATSSSAPLNLSSSSLLVGRTSSSPLKSSIILQNPDAGSQSLPGRILPEIPKSDQPPRSSNRINLKLRSLSAVRSLYCKPEAPPVARFRSRTALGNVMRKSGLLASPPKTTVSAHESTPQADDEEQSASDEECAPSPGSVAAERPSAVRIAQVAQSPAANSSPSTPSAADQLQSKNLPPKKRKFFSESPPPPSPDHAPGTKKRHAVDPGRNLVMLQELQAAVRADEDGDLPLHIAVVQGKMELVGQLLTMMQQMGSSVDQHNALWQTPLHLAFITRQMPMVRKLLSAGASVNRADRHGHTALHLCVKHFDRPQHITDFLSSADVNLNARNYEGLTALHLAVEGSEMETVRVLIDHKVDVNAVDGKGGRTPLFYACELNDKAMVQLLTEAGADIHLANYAGISPVQVASNRRCTRIVAYLVEHGADNPTVLVSPEVTPASPQVKKCLKQTISDKDDQQQEQEANRKETKDKRKKRQTPAERKKRDTAPSAIIIGETKALANINRSSFNCPSAEQGEAQPPIVLVASGSPDNSSDLEESVPSVKDVIEAMKVAMKRLGEGHPHYKVLKQRLHHFFQQNQQQPPPQEEVEEEMEDEVEVQEKVLPAIQLPSLRTSLRKKLKTKSNDS